MSRLIDTGALMRSRFKFTERGIFEKQARARVARVTAAACAVPVDRCSHAIETDEVRQCDCPCGLLEIFRTCLTCGRREWRSHVFAEIHTAFWNSTGLP